MSICLKVWTIHTWRGLWMFRRVKKEVVIFVWEGEGIALFFSIKHHILASVLRNWKSQWHWILHTLPNLTYLKNPTWTSQNAFSQRRVWWKHSITYWTVCSDSLGVLEYFPGSPNALSLSWAELTDAALLVFK